MTESEQLTVSSLKLDEGYRKNAYKCTAGKLTIGYGFNIEAGISSYAAEELLKAQVAELVGELNYAFPNWTKWFDTPEKQSGFINMNYQQGVHAVKGFKKMITALNEGNEKEARRQAFDSKWYKFDTPIRATKTIDTMFPSLKGEPIK